MTIPKICRTCGSDRLHQVLDLGKTPLANDFAKPGDSVLTRTFPLTLNLCTNCSLLQLGQVVEPGIMYSHYAYVTSTSRTMDDHLNQVVEDLIGEMSGNKVLEIASNTGLLLEKFQAKDCNVMGVEPARNIAEIAMSKGIPTMINFFNEETANRICRSWGMADLIIGRHVLAHIDDLESFLDALEIVSNADTIIAFEVPYIVDFFNGVEFDTIYHEHLSYFSVRSIQAWLKDSPFMLYKVNHYGIHGGSVMLQICRRSKGVREHESVDFFVAEEEVLVLEKVKTWKRFKLKVDFVREHLPEMIGHMKGEGKRIIGYGASAKGNTLLNVCGLTAGDLDYIVDNTPFKQGKLAPGSLIPIMPPEKLLEDQPDYALLLAWNFAGEIIAREREYQKRGGRFIIPISVPRIVVFE